jgi:hypothetical protein
MNYLMNGYPTTMPNFVNASYMYTIPTQYEYDHGLKYEFYLPTYEFQQTLPPNFGTTIIQSYWINVAHKRTLFPQIFIPIPMATFIGY